MIIQYMGSDMYTLHLTSGKEIELSEADIEEIVNENIAIKTKINNLENDVAKYRDYYHRADSKLELNRENMRLIETTLNDHTLTINERVTLIREQLKGDYHEC